MGASHIPRVSAFLSRSTSGNSSLSAALSAWCGFKTSSHCSTRKRGEAAVSIKTKSHIATDKCITLYFIFVGHKTENFCCFWLFCVLLVVVPFAFCFFFLCLFLHAAVLSNEETASSGGGRLEGRGKSMNE